MYEPKYRLNKKDEARWRLLLTRHCFECPAKGERSAKINKRFPPLTPAEDAEFEALCRKRSDKICQHPKVRASIEAGKRHDRKLRRLLNKLEKLVQQMKKTHETEL